ncbi:MAG: ATP-dependent DNA helicase [Propionibacteriaceae bacterium]
MSESLTDKVLCAAVSDMGGSQRSGQHQMAAAVEHAFSSGEHLLVQAGTGTGKSLGYLVPALVHVTQNPDIRIVVATATLALQTQLSEKDIPTALKAVTTVTGRTPKTALLKGRSNYACLYRIRDTGIEQQDTLLGGEEIVEVLRESRADADSVMGAEIIALREWAESELTARRCGDRDDAPSHSPRAWGQVSVSARECLGKQRCPYGEECFVEKSRDKARESDVIVTNHALLAIDAMNGNAALPEHHIVVIDEAHELVSRVTGAATAELSAQQIDRVAKRALPWLDDDTGIEFLTQADALREALDNASLERVTDDDSVLVLTFAAIRDISRKVVSELNSDSGDEVERKQVQAIVKEIFEISERMALLDDSDVVWVSERERFGRQAVVAPLSVAGLMRERVMKEKTVVLTSATLKLGGDFNAVADGVGLQRREDADRGAIASDDALAWRGLDVGSPFEYCKQGILYVAKNLPAPSRDGIQNKVLDEIAELIWAAGGRSLGLFSSMKAAQVAATHVRRALPTMTILCQGDANLPELVKRFASEPETSLFGTVSLWQGIDVPGDTCELVIIDKIPFPRPDEPLILARQKAVSDAGGNGFMSVAATHAALLMAQGAGRLIRRSSDRGVVAVLDPRLVTARYGGFLRKSMPDFWMTQEPEVAVQALKRLQSERN